MIIDAKRIWISGGYGLHNTLEASLKYLRGYGHDHNLSDTTIDCILAEFFLELKEDERKYMFEGHVCPCGCGIDKSGTAAVHEVRRRMTDKALVIEAIVNDQLVNELNDKIVGYMERDNAAYMEEHMPKKVRWLDTHLIGFQRVFGDKK